MTVENQLRYAREALNTMSEKGGELNTKLMFLQKDLEIVLSEKTENSGIKTELERSKQQTEKLGKELQILRTEISSIKEKNQQLEHMRVSDETIIAQLEGQLKVVHEGAQVLKARVKELEEKILVAADDLTQQLEKMTVVMDQNQQLENKNVKAQTKIGQLEVQLEKAHKVTGDLKDGVKELEGKLLMADDVFQKEEAKNKKIRQSMGFGMVVLISIIIALILKHPLSPNNLESKLSQAAAEKNNAVQNMTSLNMIVEDLTTELASVRKKHQTEMSWMMEHNQHLDKKIAKMTYASKKVKELEIEVGKVWNSWNSSEAEKVKMAEKLNRMGSEGKKLNMQLKDLQEELEIALSKMDTKDVKHIFEELRTKRAKELEGIFAKILRNEEIEASLKRKTLEVYAKDSIIEEMRNKMRVVQKFETLLAQNGIQPEDMKLIEELSEAVEERDDAVQKLNYLKKKVEDLTKEVFQETEMPWMKEQRLGLLRGIAKDFEGKLLRNEIDGQEVEIRGVGFGEKILESFFSLKFVFGVAIASVIIALISMRPFLHGFSSTWFESMKQRFSVTS